MPCSRCNLNRGDINCIFRCVDVSESKAHKVKKDVREMAIAKTSYLPAKYLEETVPQMKNKGRLQVGMDADIVVFDPATVQDRAMYERPNQTSVGMRYVLVNGVVVIRDGELDKEAFPGRPVRRTVSP